MKLSTLKTFCNPELEIEKFRNPVYNEDCEGNLYVTALDSVVIVDIRFDNVQGKTLPELPSLGKDPDLECFRSLLHAPFEKTFTIDRVALKNALETATERVKQGNYVSILCTSSRKAVLHYYDEHNFETEYVTLGDTDDKVEINVNFNPVYLLKIVNELKGDKITFGVNGLMYPVVISEGNTTFGIMQMYDK